ncbi:DUF2225 domain-containing protein [Acetonema longum]|uniref:DUF2225 domain-containing protein n=1 Tax=Acetonema longum DSM 6540 TaxID=1009370 RepID=F7NG14_9FIRM|nr:DUF2225 domain-containing protein [Acetonema longum]EGO64932.1 hypothetical protein ALO_05003 [Acetonema longum DSM 6540]
MSELMYTVEKNCPLCTKEFKTTKVRNNLAMLKQDTDFCTYYKEVNPYYYAIWVCPNCGYAVQDTYITETLMPVGEQRIRDFLKGKQVKADFSGVRTREQAVATYKLAIFYAEMSLTLASRLASLYLKLAWLYREGKQEKEEQAVLRKSLEYYEKAAIKEQFPIGNMTEITLQYLMGELYRRTGRLDDALSYLGKVVSDPLAKGEKRLLEMARDAWHLAKEDKKRMDEAVAAAVENDQKN